MGGGGNGDELEVVAKEIVCLLMHAFSIFMLLFGSHQKNKR